MAKNRTMAIKHAIAKKYAIKEMTEKSYEESCATQCIPQNQSVLWNIKHKPYSCSKYSNSCTNTV